MKKLPVFSLFSFNLSALPFAALPLAFGLFYAPSGQAQSSDLRETIQTQLPTGETIDKFIQLEPRKAWAVTTYTPENSLTAASCSLSFYTLTNEMQPRLATSFAFLTNGPSGEIRSFDQIWDLPNGNEGTLTLRTSSWQQTYPVTAETPTFISGRVSAGIIRNAIENMAQGQEIWLSFSSGQAQSLPTARIVPVINAFKDCAADHGFAALGGPLDPKRFTSNNPF